MNFRVVWIRAAENELAEMWLASQDRGRITESARDLESVLATEPENAGESCDENRRIVFVGPLAAVFEL